MIDATISYAKKKDYQSIVYVDNEIRGIYISYLEYLNNFLGNGKDINQVKIDKMIDFIKEKNFNTIFLHVSPFSDAIYNSKIFPYSYTLAGVEGKNPGFDYLEYFIKKAHQKNIKIHAWINPYRISFENNVNSLSKDNPAYKLKETSSIYIDKNGIYYNPASNLVKDLIVKQVEEIINNYNVDGIHFDDYFYIQNNIDKIEYSKYKDDMSLSDFRLTNTSDLIKRVYQVIKKKDANIIFSIAPDGNINNNYVYHFADVKKWLDSMEYIDIIMPQIYYGFSNEYAPFLKVLEEWISIHKNKDIKMVPVLAYYKLGEKDYEAGSGLNEWVNDHDIINKQIEIIRSKKLAGFTLFRYDFVKNNN